MSCSSRRDDALFFSSAAESSTTAAASPPPQPLPPVAPQPPAAPVPPQAVATADPQQPAVESDDGESVTPRQANVSPEDAEAEQAELVDLSEQLYGLEEAFSMVEGSFNQYQQSTRHAMITIGVALAQRRPALSGLVSAIVGDGRGPPPRRWRRTRCSQGTRICIVPPRCREPPRAWRRS